MQQRFWPDPQPLVERLGRDFFRTLPERPGVYFMRGAGGTVLYVGKAKNLRQRLGSYRAASPERRPRRILRLLNQVESILWEEAPDEEAALRRESELLVSLKPRFNRAGVWPGPKRFLLWRAESDGLALVVADQPETGWACVGPFGAQVVQLHRVLVRLVWTTLQPAAGLAGMPSGWFRGEHGLRVFIPHADPARTGDCSSGLAAAMNGDAAFIQDWPGRAAHPFEQASHQEDAAWLVNLIAKRASTRPGLGAHFQFSLPQTQSAPSEPPSSFSSQPTA